MRNMKLVNMNEMGSRNPQVCLQQLAERLEEGGLEVESLAVVTLAPDGEVNVYASGPDTTGPLASIGLLHLGVAYLGRLLVRSG